MVIIPPEPREQKTFQSTVPAKEVAGKSVVVHLRREPYAEHVEITMSSGVSELLTAEQAREWFKRRGANDLVVEKALDYVWNFYDADVVISNYKPIIEKHFVRPQIL